MYSAIIAVSTDKSKIGVILFGNRVITDEDVLFQYPGINNINRDGNKMVVLDVEPSAVENIANDIKSKIKQIYQVEDNSIVVITVSED